MGKFICLYGINNLGKSTQANLLVAKLREMGKKAEYLKYPIYDLEPTGPMLNKILRDKETIEKFKVSPITKQLIFTANRFQFEPELEKLLNDNDFVIAEDYIGTGIAWGITEGVAKDYLEKMNKPLTQPDLEILVDGERFTEAVEKGHVHENDNDLTDKARKAHLDLADKYGWKIVNANQSVDRVMEDIWEFVGELL